MEIREFLDVLPKNYKMHPSYLWFPVCDPGITKGRLLLAVGKALIPRFLVISYE